MPRRKTTGIHPFTERTMMTDKPSASVGSDLVGSLLKNPEIQQSIVAALLGLLTSALGKLLHKKDAPTTPVVIPTPAPNPTTGGPFLDDTIPAPAATRKVVKVVGKLARVQLNHQRFPDAPNGGLYDDVALKSAQAGGNIPFGSKIWLDATAYDAEGKEFLRDAVLSHGLAFKTEHHCGGAFIKGHGADAQGQPIAGYETNDNENVGNGISAWISSLGFLHQMKAHGEAQNDAWVVVDGVESAHFPVNVS
jgi:hypothetical protein